MLQSKRIAIAKKKFGQNFLNDESVLLQIIQSMPHNDNVIVEIGPGLGDLTKHLVNVKRVTAFEVDTDLCKYLNELFIDEIADKKLTIKCGDVLEQWDNSLINEPYDLIANLPYYIATNIILRALADATCQNLLVMVQREVAEKFTASSGDKEFCALSVITQSIATAKIVINVPPESFDPPPKVDSSVLLISKHTTKKDDEFEDFLRIAFTQKRKTLHKNLASVYKSDLIMDAFFTLGLEKTIRPHQLDTDDFHQLYKLLK